MSYAFQKEKGVRNCCRDDRNLVKKPYVPDGVTELVCKRCGAKHRIFVAEPGSIGAIIQPLRTKKVEPESPWWTQWKYQGGR